VRIDEELMEIWPNEVCDTNRRRLRLKGVMRYRGVVEGLERSGREAR